MPRKRRDVVLAYYHQPSPLAHSDSCGVPHQRLEPTTGEHTHRNAATPSSRTNSSRSRSPSSLRGSHKPPHSYRCGLATYVAIGSP